jgi:transcriptional regulator with XRE-family HTH domain/predicted GIY-YIG superfamily endonuclease
MTDLNKDQPTTPDGGRTALYRIYGDDELLLYVGIAKDFGKRWKQHAARQPWWDQVKRQTVVWYDTREEALTEEALAIQAGQPKYNLWYPFHGRSPVPSEQSIALKFRELRLAAGWSQTKVAALMVAAGWPWYQSTVGRVESYSQALRAGELLDLAEIFGVSLSRLLSGDRSLADERRDLEHALREQIAAEIAERTAAA